MKLSESAALLWKKFLFNHYDVESASARIYDIFSIGDTVDSKNHGVNLILSRTKTATSSLVWDDYFTAKGLPYVGALSILENGHGEAICVIETTEVVIKPFNEIDEEFIKDYGEWGNTLESWQTSAWHYYSQECIRLNKIPSINMPLVCERFKVVYRKQE